MTSDDTKYWYVFFVLDAETSACAARVATKALPRKRYTTMKDFLIKTFSPMRWEHAECIHAAADLCDRKSSILVNHLLSLLGEFGPDILSQQVFIGALPACVQDALAYLPQSVSVK